MESENEHEDARDRREMEKESRRALLFCSEQEADLSRVVRVYDYGEMFSTWTLTVPNPKFLSIPERKKKVKEKPSNESIYNVESKIKVLIQGQGDIDTGNGAVNSAPNSSSVFLTYRSPNTLSYDIPTWRIIVDPGSFRYIERVHPRKQKTAAKTQAKLLQNGEILNFQMVDSGGGYKEICFFDAACAFDKHLCKVTDVKLENRLSIPISGLTSEVPKLQLSHWRSEDSKIKVKLISPQPALPRSTTAATSSSCACSSGSLTDCSKSTGSDKGKGPCAFCGFCAKESPKKLGNSAVTPSPSVYTDLTHGHGIRIRTRDSQTMKSLERLKPLLQSISAKCGRIKSSEKDERMTLSKKSSYDDIKLASSEPHLSKVPKRPKSESKMDWLKLSNPISPVNGLSMNAFQIPRPVRKDKNGGVKVKTLKFSPPGAAQSSEQEAIYKGGKKLTLQETAKLGKERTNNVDVVAKLAKELDKKCKSDLTLNAEFLPTVSGQGVRLELPIPQSVYKN